MGLDVALVNGGGGVFPFDNSVGLGKALGSVALLVAEMGGHVAGLVADLAHGGRAQVLVQQGRAVLHGIPDIDDGRQHLIVHLDQCQGGLGHVGVDRSHGGNRVAFEQRLVAGNHVVGGELEPAIVSAQILLGQRGEGQVLSGDHCLYAGQGLGFAGVDGADAGVSMRAAQHLAVEQTGQLGVGAVLGPSGHLVDAVGTYGPLSYDVVFNLGKDLIRNSHCSSTSTFVINHHIVRGGF